MTEKFVLGIVDSAIFGVMLAVSACIGLYFKIYGGVQKTNEDYLLAGKNMPIFPVAFSLMATFMSTTTLMGIPAEMYLFGTHLILMNFGFIVGPIFASFVFLPIYFETHISTPYEVLYNAVVLFAPALALSAVTNLSVWTSVISIGVICTFYCTIGGMKAVLWTDVFQCFLMFICLFAIIIFGCIHLGSIGYIFKTAYDGGRIILSTFDFDFATRYTVYSVLMQGLITTSYNYSANPAQVQRSLTMGTLKGSKIANIISANMMSIFQLLCCLCGIIIYAYFKNCDPLSSPSKPIQSADQLMPYFIITTMNHYPGLVGLCIAGIFSASLSTVSSCINSMAAVTYKDIIKPIWPNLEAKSVFIMKCASLFYGTLNILACFSVSYMGNLVQATMLVAGMLNGSAFGVFLLAAFSTIVTEVGANLGLLASFLLGLCMTVLTNSRYYPTLPVENNCSNSLYSVLNETANFEEVSSVNFSNSTSSTSTFPNSEIDYFPVSYMWITPLTLSACLVVGYLYSWISTFFEGSHSDVSPILLCPLRRKFLTKSSERKNLKLREQTQQVENFQL